MNHHSSLMRIIPLMMLAVVAGGCGANGGTDTVDSPDAAVELIDNDVSDPGDADPRDQANVDSTADASDASDLPTDVANEVAVDALADSAIDGNVDPDADLPDADPDAAGDTGPDAGDPDGFIEDALADAWSEILEEVFDDIFEDVPERDQHVADDGPDVSDDVPTTVDSGGPDISTPGLAVRIVAANVTSGNYQSYDYGHGIRIMQALRPDIVLIQEMNYGDNTTSDYNELAQDVVGTSYWAVDDAGFQIPNGVLSRWPITGSGWWDDPNLSNRELMWATIDIPGPVDIFAISVHLHTSPSSDQVEAAQVIVGKVKTHRSQNPGKYLYVVGGDFNGTSAVSESGFGQDGVFMVDPPDPADDDGNVNTNASRSKQYDSVLADQKMAGYQVGVRYPSNSTGPDRVYPEGLVFDTRTFSQSELNEYFPPAQTGDSSSSQMQHMAVVKDFVIP